MDRLFRRRRSITARAVLGVLACAGLLTLERRAEHVEVLRAGLLTAVYPLQVVVDTPFRVGRYVASAISSGADLRARNSTLVEENRRLRLHLLTFSALEAENGRLATLLDSVRERQLPGRVLVAHMMAVAQDPYTLQVQLSRGSSEAVFVGQPVLDAGGVLGQITHVGRYSSQALLVTDPRHALPVKSVRGGVRAVAVGTGASGDLDLPYLPTHVDLKAGDVLVTSGLDGVFPADYPVAVVTSVGRDSGDDFARVRAKPLGHTDRIQEVLLLWPTAPAPVGATSGATASPSAEAKPGADG